MLGGKLSGLACSWTVLLYAMSIAHFVIAQESQRGWSGWRGDNRDARADLLPQVLPEQPRYRWTYEDQADSLSGIAATKQRVLIHGRDALDSKDVVTCLSTKDGSLIWQYQYVAIPPNGAQVRDGRLDYGNSPRATPLIVGDLVVVQGALGDLICLSIETGEPRWSLNFVLDFDASIPIWGWSSSPLHHDGLVFAQPGAEEASLVAVRLRDGQVQWEAAGGQAAYTSPILGFVGGRAQVITSDIHFWAGFDAQTGKRLWRLKPPLDGEFRVPTALVVDSRLALIGEANGIRLHDFDSSGKLVSQPISSFSRFNPDTHTPVLVGTKIVGVHHGLWIMSAEDLSIHREVLEDELIGHCSIVTDGTRFLVLTDSGSLLLYSLTADKPQELGRRRLRAGKSKIYSHPAWIDDALVYREGQRVHLVELK